MRQKDATKTCDSFDYIKFHLLVAASVSSKQLWRISTLGVVRTHAFWLRPASALSLVMSYGSPLTALLLGENLEQRVQSYMASHGGAAVGAANAAGTFAHCSGTRYRWCWCLHKRHAHARAVSKLVPTPGAPRGSTWECVEAGRVGCRQPLVYTHTGPMKSYHLSGPTPGTLVLIVAPGRHGHGRKGTVARLTQQRVLVDFGDDDYGSFDQHQVQVEGEVAGAADVVPAALGRSKRTLADVLAGGGQDAMALVYPSVKVRR